MYKADFGSAPRPMQLISRCSAPKGVSLKKHAALLVRKCTAEPRAFALCETQTLLNQDSHREERRINSPAMVPR